MLNTDYLDIMIGDATLFMHAGQVEAAWNIVMPQNHNNE